MSFQPKIIIGVSTRALFDLEEEHAVFEKQGLQAYASLQLERERIDPDPGAGFEVVRRLLSLNAAGQGDLVEVLLLSRNSPDLSLRAFNAIQRHGLSIERGSFTSGRSVAPYVSAWGIDLFLSNHEKDVRSVAAAGEAAAAKIGGSLVSTVPSLDSEVRIAVDGDAVVFSADSDEIYKRSGLEAFLEHEKTNADLAMNLGPFGQFMQKLAGVRQKLMRSDGTSLVRIALVTARNAPAHERVVKTLRAWGTPVDEAHFVGSADKTPFLAAFGAHIFFDDQAKHVARASKVVPSAEVPGPHAPSELVQPSRPTAADSSR